MIPNIIHYCWFGRNPLPPLAQKCIASWEKHLPNYQIKEWNEDNFNINIIPYTAEAYKLKKYAFVSDYARFWIIYNYGGIYFDTDVEIIKPIDDIIQKGAFMGFEKSSNINNAHLIAPGLGIGCISGHPFFHKILLFYKNKHYVSWKGRMTGTVVYFTTQMLLPNDFKYKEDKIAYFENINIYPDDYFSPLNYYTKELTITNNTRTIHHYAASWVNKQNNIFKKIKERFSYIYIRIYVYFKKKV